MSAFKLNRSIRELTKMVLNYEGSENDTSNKIYEFYSHILGVNPKTILCISCCKEAISSFDWATPVCDECLNNLQYCTVCDASFNKNNSVNYIKNNITTLPLTEFQLKNISMLENCCQNCLKASIHKCGVCNKYEKVGSTEKEITTKRYTDIIINNERREEFICIECCRKLTMCNVCNTYTDSVYTCEECGIENLCSKCYDIEHGDLCIHNYYIHSYHDLPTLRFYNTESDPLIVNELEGTELFFGMELELELTNTGAPLKRLMVKYDKVYDKHIWVSNDSTIQEGYEFITHPFTFDYYKQSAFMHTFIDSITALHTTSRPLQGLHIHFSKRYLSKKQQILLNMFVHYNRGLVELLAKRISNNYCNFKHYSTKEDYVNYNVTSGERRSIINFNNQHTIEFRIFSGKPDIAHINSCLEFCHALITLVKTVPIEPKEYSNINTLTLLNDLIYSNSDSYSDLINTFKGIGY